MTLIFAGMAGRIELGMARHGKAWHRLPDGRSTALEDHVEQEIEGTAAV